MILVIGGIFFSCVLPNEARDKYNKGTTALNEARYEEASTILLEARDEAGTDAAVRIDSAYNLALTHARLAKSFEQEDPQKAVNSYSESASWFRDVVQRNPEDQEARYNLEVVLKRIQLLADRLNAGTNSLESRLDRLLEDTRMLRDQVRVLADTIANGTAPSMLESEFAQLAVQVRSTQADASTIIQLSGAERGNIENKSDEEKTPQDSMRVAQLTALESYLEKGRDEIADARRVLRNEDVEKSRTRLEDSVRSIFRAREQLQDPLAVLQSISQEEGQLLQQTSILMQSKNTFVMDPNQKIPQLPSWFDGDFLSDEQDNIHARTDEMAQRFAASAAQDPSEESTEEQQEFLALMKDALPPLLSSVAAMKEAEGSLENGQLLAALGQEQQAQQDLLKAIERFADAKNLIELAYQTQQGLISLITPPQEGEELPVALDPQDRMNSVQKALQENLSRVSRLEGALKREKAKQIQEMQQNQQEPSAQENPTEQIDALYEQAEQLRLQTQNALLRMEEALQQEESGLTDAHQAEESLQQLRILFFSVVEHLKLLLEDQGTLRDETSALVAGDYEKMLASLGLTIAEQQEIFDRSGHIGEALQQQADAAAEDQERAGALAEAYAHVSTAQTAMQEAMDLFRDVQEETGGVSQDPEPALELQLEAMESLAAAIEALQPPQQDQGDEDQEQNQDQEEQMSRQQAERRLQEAREREAERAKKRQEAQGSEPVEKDW